ncbi:alpha/beta hydrolase [Streptomyces sp. NPDC005483]|uniref:alpha/beta hydrolase n=1 Tax=Streptomyces sp. NPDC005483 TaxID=3154882 RepID=UPI0033ABB4AC
MNRRMLNPQLRRRAALIPPLPLKGDRGRRVVRALIRRWGPGRPVEGVARTTVGDGLGLHVYTPDGGGSGATLLWIHGGGLIIGDALQDNAFCALTARELGIVVVSVDYRLAPEHPFPAALDDNFAAWQWLQRSAETLGIDPGRIAVGGVSAGGGLAACLAQRLHDSGGVQPAAQWLFCPMLDDRTAARRELDRLRHRVWNNSMNRIGWHAYLGGESGGPQTPKYAVAARRTDLLDLPPAWIGVGDIDLFADEDRDYARRLQDAGVHCTLELVPGAPHGFETWAAHTPLARGYLERARAWLGERLTEPTSPIPGGP